MTTCFKCRKVHPAGEACPTVAPVMHPPKPQGKTIRIPSGGVCMDGNGKRLAYEFKTVRLP